jgi:hypothetical protein
VLLSMFDHLSGALSVPLGGRGVQKGCFGTLFGTCGVLMGRQRSQKACFGMLFGRCLGSLASLRVTSFELRSPPNACLWVAWALGPRASFLFLGVSWGPVCCISSPQALSRLLGVFFCTFFGH